MHELRLWVLRDGLGLSGTHYGCGIGGSCTVLVDGQMTSSCLTPVAERVRKSCDHAGGAGKDRVGRRGDVAPRSAGVRGKSLQCGWCLPGHMMSAVALLIVNSVPTSEQIDDSVGINLCRCGGYNNVRKAVARAARMDPLDFCLKNLLDSEDGQRLRPVPEQAAIRSGWRRPPLAGRARGVACCLEVNTASAQVAEVSARWRMVRCGFTA